jgi:hypothetical protein
MENMMDSVIQFRGTIYENGYGLLAQKVMRDKRLPKQSKLIYAYMCSFAGVDENGNRSAFPSVALQCDELGMNETTYYKWRKYLVELGYITIEKQKTNQGKFDRNLYFIEAMPVEKEPEKVETEPYPKKSGMEPTPKNSCTVKGSMEKSGTNSNSSNSNSFNSNKELVNKEAVNKQNLIDICNTFFKTFASGRWSKKQWNKVIELFVDELLEDGRMSFVDNVEGYIRNSLKNIAYRHDFKNGKVDEPEKVGNMPFYNWLES